MGVFKQCALRPMTFVILARFAQCHLGFPSLKKSLISAHLKKVKRSLLKVFKNVLHILEENYSVVDTFNNRVMWVHKCDLQEMSMHQRIIRDKQLLWAAAHTHSQNIHEKISKPFVCAGLHPTNVCSHYAHLTIFV